MEINEKLKNDLIVILNKLGVRVEEDRDEVVATLKSVADGELVMVETITSEEEEYARELFGWIAGVGPEKISLPIFYFLESSFSSGEYYTLGSFLKFLTTEYDDGYSYLPPLPPRDDSKFDARIIVLLMAYIFYEDFHYPQPEVGVYDIANNPFERLKWVYRYWLNQLEVAEKGSGIEDIFAIQDLSELAKKKPFNAPSLSISCAGDLLAVDVLTPENTRNLFDEIKDFYSVADIVSANLESTVDDREEIGRTQNPGEPARMNTSQEMFDKFRYDAKINLFSTATNHAMDWGVSGICKTIDVLAASGAKYTGTAKSKEQQDKNVVVSWPVFPPGVEIEDLPSSSQLKVGFLAYTMDLNGFSLPADEQYHVNEVRFNDVNPAPDYSLIKEQVKRLRAGGVNWIVAYVHWGWEFEMYPHSNIREAAQEIISCGVDTILGNHAHVSQPAELIPRPGLQDALVIYSFGDFVSYHPESRNSKISYMVKFDVVDDRGRYFISDFKVEPIYIVNEALEGGGFNCRIVKFQSVLNSPDSYGLTELEKSQLPHLRDKVWQEILSPLSKLSPLYSFGVARE